MIVRMSGLAALGLALAACGSQESEPTAQPSEAAAATEDAGSTEAAVASEGDTASPPVAEEEAAAEEQAPAALTVAGTIDSIVLDGEEPMVIVNGSDGTNYLGVAAPGAIDTILDNTGGIGSAISLECQETDLPPEDGYVWVEGCKLS